MNNHIQKNLEMGFQLGIKKALRTTSPELSFIIPAFNEEGNIADVIEQVASEAEKHVATYEILIIDDGSSDETLAIAKSMKYLFPVGTIRLSRNFGKEQAIMAGLERSSGNAVVILDADLQEPISHLEKMLEYYRNGYEMVYCVRSNRNDESYLKRFFTKTFYGLLSLGSDIDIPSDARDCRLMDRRVVDALCNLKEKSLFMKGLYSWVGFRTKAIPIELNRRQTGESKFGIKKLTKLAITGLTSFSDLPLRVWTGIGMVIASLSILWALWIISKTLIWGIDLPGWASLTVAVFFFAGIQLISIGILGEYLARVFTEVKGRPGYIIAEETNSEILKL